MSAPTNTTTTTAGVDLAQVTRANQGAAAQQPQSLSIDFDSDEPITVCPLRPQGLGDSQVCEACQ